MDTSSRPVSLSPWVKGLQPDADVSMRLFCFPYAGGNAAIYRPWQPFLSPQVQICAVELPGRGALIGETPRTNLRELVDELAAQIRPLLDVPFALLGHSMGGAIALRLAKDLETAGGESPVRLFVLGNRPPHIHRPRARLYRLSDQDLIKEIRAFEGTPKEVLDHPELMQLLLPVLRADFQMLETCPLTTGRPLQCGLTVCAGQSDPDATVEEMEEWADYTEADFVLRCYAGNHFFPWSCLGQIIQDIESDLLRH